MCKKINTHSRRRNKSLGLSQEANKERAKICSSSYRYPTKAQLATLFDKKVTNKYHNLDNPDDLITSHELIFLTSICEQHPDTLRRKDAFKKNMHIFQKLSHCTLASEELCLNFLLNNLILSYLVWNVFTRVRSTVVQ